MTVVEHPQTPQSVPHYVATLTSTDEIIGIGPDSIVVVGKSLWLYRYVDDLAHRRLASAPATVNFPSPIALASYSEVRRQLDALRNAPEADEFGRVRPSDSAISTATRVTFSMVQAGHDMPMVEDVATDSDGAIRILWTKDNRALELVCPFQPSQRPYWYYSDSRDYRIEYEQSPEVLQRLVAWLNGETSIFPR